MLQLGPEPHVLVDTCQTYGESGGGTTQGTCYDVDREPEGMSMMSGVDIGCIP